MKRDFTIGVAWLAGALWFEQAAAALVFLVIARLIGVETFGVASMAFAFLFLGEMLVRDTVTEAIIARDELEEGRLEATFAVLTGFALAIVLALCLAAVPVARLYGRAEVAPILVAVSPTVLFIGLAGVPTALLRRRMAYKTMAIRISGGVIAGGAVGLAMAWQGYGAWSLVGQRLATSGVNALVSIGAAGWLPRRLPRRAELGLVRGLGVRVVWLRGLALVIMQTPTVALGVFAGATAAGLFSFAFRLTDIAVTLLVRPFKGVAQSALAALRRQGGATAPFYLDLAELATLVAFAAFAGLALTAGPVVAVLGGPDWAPAAALLPWLAVFGAVSALTAIQEAYLLALDRLQAFLAATLAEAALGLVLVIPAALAGSEAVAVAVAARALLALPLRSAAAHAPEAIPIGRLLRALVPPALVALAMSAVVALVLVLTGPHLSPAPRLGVAVAAGLVTVAALLFGAMPATLGRLKAFLQGERVDS